MPKHTQWICDGCDVNLGSGDKRPRAAIEADVKLESTLHNQDTLEFHSLLCRECFLKLRNAIDTRMWVKHPEGTSRLPAVILSPPPEDGA